MKTLLLAVLLGTLVAVGQPAPLPIQDGQTIRLWNGPAPGALGQSDTDIPTITAYLPRTTTGPMTAVIIMPGGGYRNLAQNHEGRQIANFFNSAGVAAFVLTYRLGPRYHHPVELGDGQRAVRMLRAHASEWHIAADRIGVVGFSAGGHLAALVSTKFDSGNPSAADLVDRAQSRPDFSVLAYPVISMSEAWTHAGSRQSLLGDAPSPELLKSLSADTAVNPRTPPTFLFQTNADTVVPAENAVSYYLALRKAGVPAEIHVFENGPHGVGLAADDPALEHWSALLLQWMRGRKLL